jgi:hypothetical protein
MRALSRAISLSCQARDTNQRPTNFPNSSTSKVHDPLGHVVRLNDGLLGVPITLTLNDKRSPGQMRRTPKT